MDEANNLLAQLQAAAARVDACQLCTIGCARTKSVYADGNPFARLMVVGEGPGEQEDLQGKPFVGPAGQLLDKMLAAIGMKRAQDVYICNTVKCRPTTQRHGRTYNRPPDETETQNCRPYLQEQIDLIRPAIILAMGAPAARWFLGPDTGITRARGRWYAGPHQIPLMVTYHPAYILRLQGQELLDAKRQVWSDLQAVQTRLTQPIAEIEPQTTQPIQTQLFSA